MTSTAQFYKYELQSKVQVGTADPCWLADLLPETMLDAATELKTAIAAAGAANASGTKPSEAVFQDRLMPALRDFVAAASDEQIFAHDTHEREFLRGLSPDVAGTAMSTKSEHHVTALLVALLIDLKKPGQHLDNPGVKGQVGQYAMEVIAACPVDGPFTAAVMNDTEVVFLRVSGFRSRAGWESGPHSWDGDGVQRMYAYVRECVARLAKAATWNMEWFSNYVPVEYLGSGISARTLAVCPRPPVTTGATMDAKEAAPAATATSANKAAKKKKKTKAGKKAVKAARKTAAMDDSKDDGDEAVKLDVTYTIKLFDTPVTPSEHDAARSPTVPARRYRRIQQLGAAAAAATGDVGSDAAHAGTGAAGAGGGGGGGGTVAAGGTASTIPQTGLCRCLFDALYRQCVVLATLPGPHLVLHCVLSCAVTRCEAGPYRGDNGSTSSCCGRPT
jgi:hypothetical protein